MDPVLFVLLLLSLLIAAIVFARLQPYSRKRSQQLEPTTDHADSPSADASAHTHSATSSHSHQRHGTPQHHETTSVHQHHVHVDTPTFHHH